MTNIYDVGDVVTITGTFRDAGGNLVDPTTVTASVRDPAGAVTTPPVSRSSLGVYAFTVEVDANGTWYYRLEGTGTNQSAAEGQFAVRESAF